ncbi:hypothetical protein TcasGA2_TC033292 [Tribolium castaneum]|uniref:Uncharacterized protein n=1 Tax=Tribolium castaneum TaxID=7070 RepID=A0A139WA06_TRICA|nr:hypothetical protein TcasGA2_TC033292 [Tribolium castaneum]
MSIPTPKLNHICVERRCYVNGVQVPKHLRDSKTPPVPAKLCWIDCFGYSTLYSGLAASSETVLLHLFDVF